MGDAEPAAVGSVPVGGRRLHGLVVASAWNRKKDRPSVLDVERLLRRHGSEIRNLLAKWLGKEEGAAREPAAGAAWGAGRGRWPGRLSPEIRPLPSESGGNEGEAA